MFQKIPLSPVRKFMLWIFSEPSNDPYVKINLDFDFENALKFLENYNKRLDNKKVSIHHFLLKVLADTLASHPRLNVRIFGSDVYQLPSVNIATPINLINQEWAPKKSELGVILVQDAQKKSLEQVADEVVARRKGSHKKQGIYLLEEITKFLSQKVPNFSLRLFFEGVSLLGRNRYVYGMLEDFIGVSTVFTNVGSIIDPQPGIYYKSVSFNLPDRLIHFSTCFAAGPFSPKVFVENNQPVIRNVLPFFITFDHRVVDGFLMNRFIEDLGIRIYSPDKYYSLPEIAQAPQPLVENKQATSAS